MRRVLWALMLSLPIAAWANACPVATLAAYGTQGFPCTSDDLRFSGFSYFPGAGVPLANLVTVVPIGLEFRFTARWSAISTSTFNGMIGYTVGTLSRRPISNASLIMAAIIRGTGTIDVTKATSPTITPQSLKTLFVFQNDTILTSSRVANGVFPIAHVGWMSTTSLTIVGWSLVRLA